MRGNVVRGTATRLLLFSSLPEPGPIIRGGAALVPEDLEAPGPIGRLLLD